MATYTAQILVGYPHPYHGGIIPTHHLYLSENSRPAWVLSRQEIRDPRPAKDDVVWIPTVENMLEDAFLMIAVHVLNDSGLIALASTFSAEKSVSDSRWCA